MHSIPRPNNKSIYTLSHREHFNVDQGLFVEATSYGVVVLTANSLLVYQLQEDGKFNKIGE